MKLRLSRKIINKHLRFHEKTQSTKIQSARAVSLTINWRENSKFGSFAYTPKGWPNSLTFESEGILGQLKLFWYHKGEYLGHKGLVECSVPQSKQTQSWVTEVGHKEDLLTAAKCNVPIRSCFRFPPRSSFSKAIVCHLLKPLWLLSDLWG